MLRWFGQMERMEENTRIRCKRCEVEKKAKNGMDRW